MVPDRSQWNNLVEQAAGGSFLQSWEWGELQGSMGLPYRRFFSNENEGAMALAIRRPLFSNRSWIYIPRGPLWHKKPALLKLLPDVQVWAEEQRAVFIRVEPPIEVAHSLDKSWRKSERDVQPRHTLMLNLTDSLEDMRADMHPKTRYNIGLAERSKVAVRFSTAKRDINAFITLSKEVKERSGFRYHPDDYYLSLLRSLAPANMIELAVAELNGVPLAINLLISCKDTVTYAHGASSSTQREFMAPHLLQWETIRRAKENGYKSYDLYGVAPPNAGALHPWAGITRFKKGFGGQLSSYAGAYDHVIDPVLYWFYNMAHRIKQLPNKIKN